MRSITWILISVLIAGIATGEDISDNFSYDGLMRSYELHIPPQHDGVDSLPLILNLHGYTSSGSAQRDYTQMNLKADVEGFIVCYPNGTGGIPGWNAGTCCGSAVNDNIDDVGFLSALIDTICDNYVVDTLRIYATGMSNGGMMSHRLACELSDRIAAVAPVAGGLVVDDWDQCQPERPVPVIHFHARDDGVVPYNGNSSFGSIDSVMNSWAQRNGCDSEPDSSYNELGAFLQIWTKSNADTLDTLLMLWTTEDGGHTWPGAAGGSQTVSANDEMWKFFKIHPIPIEEEPEPSVEEIAEPSFELNPVFIDPTSASISIRFSLAYKEGVSLRLFDVIGREWLTLVDETLSAGEHEVVLETEHLPSGVYFYRLESSTITLTRSFTVFK